MTSTSLAPVGTISDDHGYDALESDTYTAHRLKHASPEHLHLTTRRFFIGPIPEGWLNSNRKSWYKRRLELSSYSSRRATFTAATATGPHQRTLTGLEGPSIAARLSLSFPQPEDIDESGGESTDVEDHDDNEVVTRNIAPVATQDVPQILGIADDEEPDQPKVLDVPRDSGIKTGLMVPTNRGRPVSHAQSRISKSPGKETFITARESREHDSNATPSKPTPDVGPSIDGPLSPARESMGDTLPKSDSGSPHSGKPSSRTPLLPKYSSSFKSRRTEDKSLAERAPAPVANDGQDDRVETPIGRTSTGVRFRVTEEIAQRQERIANRVDSTRDKLTRTRFRRTTLQEGQIIKMEKMLVRVDLTMQQLSDAFDENESLKTETRALEKWREFMVVARRSKVEDSDDFRLQMYKTRVIPEIDNESAKRKPTREIRLDPKTTSVNLYSSLDKSVVMWHPYRKGTRIIIMRPRSNAHSVEWYTFLKDSLGWKRPATLQVNVPDLDVSLKLENPFEGLQDSGLEDIDEDAAIAKAMAAEQAVAGKIIKKCLDMLEADPEWTGVLDHWCEKGKIGLAWKRYDRLEWVHGVHEQKMYGSMAMQQSHDLELRPKQHYPTTTFGKKGAAHEEPTPIEGFLIRLTSQKGTHQRFGKTYFKRLYFSTQNQFLVFNRPSKATPPHPPRLATISGKNIPSSHEIVEATPTTFEVDPFPLFSNEGQKTISWLSSGNRDLVSRHDREAYEEARRNAANLSSCDGYINMCRIRRVREIHWGAAPVDDDMDSGSDVDFHQEVEDSRQEDGATKELDDDRIFELVLDNGLVVRLQAYNRHTRDEWMKRLRKLIKYWKQRTIADMDLFKSVRRSNLATLNIDEEMEAIVGQFAHKWEVQRSEASPQLYHMCGIGSCRPIIMSGQLYRKVRRHSTFHHCGVLLAGGQLLIFQSSLRRTTGEQIPHIHQEKQEVIDLKDCYVYSGLITEDDLLYRNRTFDSNHPGLQALPRIYLEDGWTSTDEDAMTCFVVWRAVKRGWFRAVEAVQQTAAAQRSSLSSSSHPEPNQRPSTATAESDPVETRRRLRRVAQLGVPGRAMVFKCRSRAERDHWVLGLADEIERLVEAQEKEGRDVRFAD